MPSLSTFMGLVLQLAAYSFGVEVIGWMVAGLLKEVDEIVDESMRADWQNAKGKGLRYAQDFMQNPWAIKNGFKNVQLSKEMINKLLKGEIKNLEQLKEVRESLITKNYDEYQSTLNYTAFYTTDYNEEIKKDIVLIDSIFINQ